MRPVPSPEPWVSDCRAAAAALHRVPAFVPGVPAPRAPAPVPPVASPAPAVSPRGWGRAVASVAAGVIAWLVMSGVLFP